MNFSPAIVSSLVWRHIYPPVRIVIRRWVKKADDSDETTHQRNVIFFDHTNTDKSQSRKSNLKTTKDKTWMGATVKEMCMNQWGKQERYSLQAAGKILEKYFNFQLSQSWLRCWILGSSHIYLLHHLRSLWEHISVSSHFNKQVENIN